MTSVGKVTGPEPGNDRLDRLIEDLHRSHDPARRRRIRAEVVTSALDLADRLAHRYVGRGIERDDLEQVARTALVAAVDRYRPGRGGGFVAFAVPTITGELKRHFRDAGWMVRPPRPIQEMQVRVAAVEGLLSQRVGHDATAEEIAREIGCSPDDVQESRRAASGFRPVSLNEPTPAGDDFADRVPDPVDRFAAADRSMDLRSLMAPLSPRDRRIVRLRFVEGRSQAEIGSTIGVTQMQVSRLLGRILEDLRANYFAPSPRRRRARRGRSLPDARRAGRPSSADRNSGGHASPRGAAV